MLEINLEKQPLECAGEIRLKTEETSNLHTPQNNFAFSRNYIL